MSSVGVVISVDHQVRAAIATSHAAAAVAAASSAHRPTLLFTGAELCNSRSQ